MEESVDRNDWESITKGVLIEDPLLWIKYSTKERAESLIEYHKTLTKKTCTVQTSLLSLI